MEPIKAQFILNPEKDQDTTGHSYSKASDIDKGIAFMACEVSERNLYVVLYHGFILMKEILSEKYTTLKSTWTIIL
jgi:hypothetical protein